MILDSACLRVCFHPLLFDLFDVIVLHRESGQQCHTGSRKRDRNLKGLSERIQVALATRLYDLSEPAKSHRLYALTPVIMLPCRHRRCTWKACAQT